MPVRQNWPRWLAIPVLALLISSLGLAGCGAKGDPAATATPVGQIDGTPIPMITIVTPTPGLPPAAESTASSTPDDAPPPDQGQEQNGTYTVQPGDTLFGIATKFNVTIEALMNANSMSDPDELQANQVLVIP